MRVRCIATIPDEKKRISFYKCVQIIGGRPEIIGNDVRAEYEGDMEVVSKYIDLFERCENYDIRTTFSERR